jgi:glycosyltransferase involved in cell wall biosynthesis
MAGIVVHEPGPHPDSAPSIRFGVMGDLGAPRSLEGRALVLEWEDGRRQRVALVAPDAAAPGGRWRRYLRTGTRLARRGQWGAIVREVWRVGRAMFPADIAPDALLAWLGSKPLPVLVVDHGQGGGSDAYSADLVAELRARGLPVLRLLGDPETLGYRLVGFRGRRTRTAAVADAVALARLFGGVRFGETYFNNLLSLAETPAIVSALARWLAEGRLGPLTFLVHDYYSVCPSWVLVDSGGRHCGVPALDACARCLPANPVPFASFARQFDIPAWRRLWAPLLEAATEVRCFSPSSRALLLRAHPALAHARVTVVPHATRVRALRAVRRGDRGAPVVGVVGSISGHKGARVLRELAAYLRDHHSPTRLVVVGTTECELAPEIATVTGPYARHELPSRLESHGVNVAFMPSIWPETYSFVTDELMQMGLPLLVFDLGAPAERVRAYARGRVIPVGGPAETAAAIHQLYLAHRGTETS